MPFATGQSSFNKGSLYMFAIQPRCVVLLAAIHSVAGAALSHADDAGTFNLLLENDVFGGTDRHYTNGFQLSYLSAPRDGDSATARAAQWLPGIAAGDEVRFGWHVGQTLFTPQDTEAEEFLPDQRPYAAWLYGGFSIVNATPSHLDTWSLSVGTMGPDAHGEEVQNAIHDWIEDDPVNGWDNQLGNQIGAQLIVERKWRALAQTDVWRLGVDVMPSLAVAAGNLESYALAGFTLRVGNDLDNDFGPPRIRPSLPGSSFFVPHDNWAWYLFLGVDGRYVARNQFIEGTDDDIGIETTKEDWVGDAQAGFVLTRKNFRLAYTYVYRTEEFEQQDEPDQFGSLALTLRF